MDITDNVEQDIYIKKLVANVNIGLLEKSNNNSEKAFLFNNLSEARHYEKQYGGNINFIRQFKEVITKTTTNLDTGLDAGVAMDEDNSKLTVTYSETIDRLYILCVERIHITASRLSYV